VGGDAGEGDLIIISILIKKKTQKKPKAPPGVN
jgi:hypothetical protein